MIGLEFICKEYAMDYRTLAAKLNITSANITNWIKGVRDIPKKKLPELSTIFNGISPEYFQKELSHIDELKIRISYIENMSMDERMESTTQWNEEMTELVDVLEDGFKDQLNSLKIELENAEKFNRVDLLVKLVFNLASRISQHKLEESFNGINVGDLIELQLTKYLRYMSRLEMNEMKALDTVIDFLNQYYGKDKNKAKPLEAFPNEKLLAFHKDLEDVLAKHNVI